MAGDIDLVRFPTMHDEQPLRIDGNAIRHQNRNGKVVRLHGPPHLAGLKPHAFQGPPGIARCRSSLRDTAGFGKSENFVHFRVKVPFSFLSQALRKGSGGGEDQSDRRHSHTFGDTGAEMQGRGHENPSTLHVGQGAQDVGREKRSPGMHDQSMHDGQHDGGFEAKHMLMRNGGHHRGAIAACDTEPGSGCVSHGRQRPPRFLVGHRLTCASRSERNRHDLIQGDQGNLARPGSQAF